MNFGRFARRSFDGGAASCQHVSTTYGVEPVRRYWRSQERKDISRKQGCARISKPKVHHTHVSLFLYHPESVICSKNTVTCTNRVTPQVLFFQTPRTLQVKNARSKSWGAAHERTKAVSSVLSASWRNRNRERGRGIMSGNCGADDVTLCAFFTCPISGCMTNVSA